MAFASLSHKAAAEAGFPVAVRHPKTNRPLGTTIVVCGADSDTHKKIIRKQLNRRMELSSRNRNKLTMTAEELETESMDVVVACTKSWATGERPELEMNEGEWLPCTPDNARRVYEELPWLKEQIELEISDRNNFLKD